MRKLWKISACASVLLGNAVATHELFAASMADFEGKWSIRIVVSSGPCHKLPGWRYKLSIRNGFLSPAEQSGSIVVNGKVDNSGKVSATAQRGGDRAIGTGMLTSQNGSGTWSSKSRGCSGTWTARKAS